MKSILAAVSSNRLLACLSGIAVTAVIQSSSATSVMLVGFVNAGLMNMAQAVGVALGAKIGTTMTGQLLAFNITDAALPAMAVGCFMRVFATSRRTREIGGVILGFGLLFYGMVLMKVGVNPFKESETMISFFTRFDAHTLGGRFFCVLVGIICTMVVQSSSVTVGLTMALAIQGLISLPDAAALVIGDNIGTTITAELAAIGTDISARRTARANTLCSIIGAIYMFILFPSYLKLTIFITQFFSQVSTLEVINGQVPQDIARYVANAHTVFNFINSTIFLHQYPSNIQFFIQSSPFFEFTFSFFNLFRLRDL
jgi:phosphate:Na+ symporter